MLAPLNLLFDFGASDLSVAGNFGGYNPVLALFDGFGPSNVIPPVTPSIPLATFNGGIRILTEKQGKKRRHNADYILLLLT